MSHTTSLMQQFRQMPRAIQWAIIAAIGMFLFMAWDQYLKPVADDWNTRAEVIQTQVREVRAGEQVAQELQRSQLKNLVTSMGPVRVPVSVPEGSKRFNDFVLDVLKKHNIGTHDYSFGSRGKMPKNVLTGVTAGKRLDRYTGDLKFDATPKVAAAIIAELESSPDIESINSARLTRDTGGKVKVHLVIEAWLLSTESGSGATL